MSEIIRPSSSVSPLEAVVLRDTPYQVGRFAGGASIARRALATINPEKTLTIAPLRGAMPIVWAADGLSEIEPAIDNTFVEIPIGQYVYLRDGRLRDTSPKRDQKIGIIDTYLTQVLEQDGRDPYKTSLAIVDEVQKGGTLSAAVTTARAIAGRRDFLPRIQVVAAQDARRKIAAEPKTEMYRELASNSVEDTDVTVIPMPLITVDRDVLLDTVRLDGTPADSFMIATRLTVERNKPAEELFRALGSLARNGELRHDDDFIWSLVESQGLTTEKASNKVELWFARLVHILDDLQQEKR